MSSHPHPKFWLYLESKTVEHQLFKQTHFKASYDIYAKLYQTLIQKSCSVKGYLLNTSLNNIMNEIKVMSHPVKTKMDWEMLVTMILQSQSRKGVGDNSESQERIP